MQARFYSCASKGASVWLLVHPTTPTFHLSSTHFFTTLHINLNLQYPTVAHLSWCQCGHTINDLSMYPFA
jgi:hypothetical protein